jgi:hypothetical protein
MTITRYEHFGGLHTETGALRNILNFEGILAPDTESPFTEEMLLGIGGGIGVTYFVYNFNHQPRLFMNLRYLSETHEGFLQTLCARVEASPSIKGTGSQKLAESNVKEALASGHPPIAWLDLSKTPYFFQPSYLAGYFPDTVVICHFDEIEQLYLIDNRSQVPLTVDSETLALARASIRSQKNRTMIVEPPTHQKSLKEAVEAGIRDCCNRMINPRIGNFGLKGLLKWTEMLGNTKAKDGWAQTFRPGPYLYQALTGTYYAIEGSSTGGNAFRSMYTRFLLEAQQILETQSLGDIAAQYHGLASMWTDLANAVLPDSIPLFKEYKEIVRQRDHDFLSEGIGTSSTESRINSRLIGNEYQAANEFPLNDKEAVDLLADVRDHIFRIYAEESKAITALKQAVP